MKNIYSYISLIFIILSSVANCQSSLTDILSKQFNQAWNKENVNEMVSLLQPDAFFKSPYQLQYGREKMAATVLKKNPPVYKIVHTKELHSKVDDDIAWSIAEFTCDVYDDYGNKTSNKLEGTYTYVFTRKDKADWKLQMMIFHDEIPKYKN
jgi:ketosteroid isomerase-like protein